MSFLVIPASCKTLSNSQSDNNRRMPTDHLLRMVTALAKTQPRILAREATLLRDLFATTFPSKSTMHHQLPCRVSLGALVGPRYRRLASFLGHFQGIYSVGFDAINRRIITGSDDCSLKVWCVRTGRLIHCMRGHTVRRC